MTDVQHLMSCWNSPKIARRDDPATGGGAAYALEPIAKGELLVMWGGSVTHESVFKTLPEKVRSLSVQIEENLYLVTIVPSVADYINHSCNPNAVLYGYAGLIAWRDIKSGEDICYDYATTDGGPYDEFQCLCGAPDCRQIITGNDWKNPALWEKYDGHFSPYLQRRIDALKATQSIFQSHNGKRG